MFAYFYKDKFLKFILNGDDEAFKKRMIRALGHKEEDVEIFRYNTQLRNDANYYFDENKDLVILREEEAEIKTLVDGVEVVSTHTVSVFDYLVEKEEI